MVQWVKDTFRWYCEPLLEADDIMGILGSAPGHSTIIVSDDKDMKCIPASLYRPTTGELLVTNERTADYNFLTQALMGDVTDGYSGCPRLAWLQPRRSWTRTPAGLRLSPPTKSKTSMKPMR